MRRSNLKRFGFHVTAFGHDVVGVVRARDEVHAVEKLNALYGIEITVAEEMRPDLALVLELQGHKPPAKVQPTRNAKGG